jgi:hypothetical protein
VLVRLWLDGADVHRDELEPVLSLTDCAPLLERDGNLVRAAYDLTPYGDESHDWYVVSDRTDPAGRPVRDDHVLGIGRAATTLAGITVRTPVERALDIGTGCGVQALHLSTHAQSVTATDVVPRALSLAATTFALSGVDAERVEGDLTAPVAGRRFDLVVANPPFVVGAPSPLAYRDGAWSDPSRAGDGMSRAAVRAAAAVLADGGVAQLLVNWLHVRGADWRDRVAGWVDDLSCDAWLIQRDVQDPRDYVRTWSADAGEEDAASRDAWLQWFADERVDGIGFGWVILRRADTPQRISVEEVLHEVDQPLGAPVAGWLDRIAWLRTLSDDELLAAHLVAAPTTRLDTAAVPSAGGWTPVASSLRLDAGFRWTLPCDDATAAIVAACDGSRALAAVVAVLEVTTGIDRSELAPAVCATVRGLVDRGLLLPPPA